MSHGQTRAICDNTCTAGQAQGQRNCDRLHCQSRTETVRPDLTFDQSPPGLRWCIGCALLRVILSHGRPVAVPGYTARITNVSGARCSRCPGSPDVCCLVRLASLHLKQPSILPNTGKPSAIGDFRRGSSRIQCVSATKLTPYSFFQLRALAHGDRIHLSGQTSLAETTPRSRRADSIGPLERHRGE